MRKNEGSSNPMYGKKHTEETKRKISEIHKKLWADKEKPRKGHKQTNKNQFRKYPNHPAINYEDFILDNSEAKRYKMKCLECGCDKGYRKLDSINLSCFKCAMAKNIKYSDIQRRIRGAAKARLNSRLRRKRLGRGTNVHFKDFPFTLTELMNHLEKLFKAGMSWHNYGEWHIDHIRPDSSFSYSSSQDNEFLKCWSLENLQPLWKIDNLKKGAKYEKGT